MKKDSADLRRPRKSRLIFIPPSETAFFLTLYNLKTNKNVDLNEVKVLLDSIVFDEKWIENKITKISTGIKSSWDYIYKAGKLSPDYNLISKSDFEEFINTEFGESIKNVLYGLLNLKEVAEKGETTEFKVEMAVLQAFCQGILSLNGADKRKIVNLKACLSRDNFIVEETSQGIKLTGNDPQASIEFELYYELNGKLKRISGLDSIEKTISEYKAFYLKSGQDFIGVLQDENNLLYTVYYDVPVMEDEFDLSLCRERVDYVLPKDQLKFEESKNGLEGDALVSEVESITESQSVIITPGQERPVKEINEMYRIPSNVKVKAYFRYKVITAIFEEVTKHFPDLSHHVKSIVTGYFAIPFKIMDSEDVHNQSERIQTYHEYVGKTVRNILNSKPIG